MKVATKSPTPSMMNPQIIAYLWTPLYIKKALGIGLKIPCRSSCSVGRIDVHINHVRFVL